MSTLDRKFEWYLEHKAEIAGFRMFLRDVEGKLSDAIVDWANWTARDSLNALSKGVDGSDFGDIIVRRDEWGAIWWYKQNQYNDQGRGAYIHLFIPGGRDWLDKESDKESTYMGFVLNYGDNTDIAAAFIRNNMKDLPIRVVTPERVIEDNGDMQCYIYDLRNILSAANLAKSERAAREFDLAVKEFTIPTLRAVSIIPPELARGV